MRTKRALTSLTATAVLAGALLVACGGDGGADGADIPGGDTAPDAAIDLDGRTFLSHTVAVAGRDRPLVDGTRITLSFDDGRVGASAGCNSMGAEYDLEGAVLHVGDLSTTEMGCDPDRHDQDSWLAGFLADSPEVRLSEAELTLTAGDTVVALVDREVAEPDVELTGTRWVLASIIDGDVASSVPSGIEATFEISVNGTVSVAFGCNSGGGTAEIGDSTVTFGALSSTKMRCDDAVMQVEDMVSTVLQGEVAYEIDADVLSMRSGDRSLDWRAAR